MNYFDRTGRRCVVVLSLLLLSGACPSAWAADKKPVHLEILLPEDAELEINGYKTKSTGEMRRFESAPVLLGRTYQYSLKVFWHGHTLTRRTEVRPAQPLTLDLRKELAARAAPKPAGSFALLAPPALMLRADEHLVFPLRVKRFDFPGSIRIHFEDLPRGITIPEVSLTEGQSETNAMLFAETDAPQGSHEIRVAAASGAIKDVSTIEITVAKPEVKIESKPEKKPASRPEIKVEYKPDPQSERTVEHKPETNPTLKPTKFESQPSPGLCVWSPSQVVLQPGQTQYVEVKTAMNGQGLFPTEPTIRLDASPDSHLAWELWTAFDFKASQADRTVGFAVEATSESQPREQQVKVVVAAGSMKTERTIAISIQPRQRKPDAKTEAIVPLRLVVPEGIEVKSRETAYLEMRVQTQDGSPLGEAPSVMLANADSAGLRFEPWTSSFKAGEAVCTLGIAIAAETNARAGERQVRVRAVSGRSTAEHSLRVSVGTGR